MESGTAGQWHCTTERLWDSGQKESKTVGQWVCKIVGQTNGHKKEEWGIKTVGQWDCKTEGQWDSNTVRQKESGTVRQ